MTTVEDMVTLQLERRGSDAGPFHRQFEELADRGRVALHSGNLEEGLRLFDEALAIAQQSADPELTDLAFCFRSSVATTLGGFDGVAELREILMRNRDYEISYMAA